MNKLRARDNGEFTKSKEKNKFILDKTKKKQIVEAHFLFALCTTFTR